MTKWVTVSEAADILAIHPGSLRVKTYQRDAEFYGLTFMSIGKYKALLRSEIEAVARVRSACTVTVPSAIRLFVAIRDKKLTIDELT